MKEKGNALSRNPNLCACCSSLLDGMEDETILEANPAATEAIPAEKPPDLQKAA